MSVGAGLSLGRLAEALNATLDGPPEQVVTGVAALASAGPDDLSFVVGRRHLEAARASRAGAFLVPGGLAGLVAPTLRCRDPRHALAEALRLFHPVPPVVPGVDPSARVSPDARVDPTASVGAFAVIEPGASIGPGVRVGAFVYLGARVEVGAGSILFPHVTIYDGCRLGARVIVHAGAVIGSDGFGFVPGADAHLKIPQVGTVTVQDDVEIGANSTIDRATLGETVVGRGTKIDNLVHIGHNVEVGARCLMAAQVGIAGSAHLGRDVMIGGQAGIGNQVDVGDAAVISAQSGVVKDVPDGQRVALTWARPGTEAQRIWVAQGQLPDLLRRVKTLERRVATLGGRAGKRR